MPTRSPGDRYDKKSTLRGGGGGGEDLLMGKTETRVRPKLAISSSHQSAFYKSGFAMVKYTARRLGTSQHLESYKSEGLDSRVQPSFNAAGMNSAHGVGAGLELDRENNTLLSSNSHSQVARKLL